MFIDPQISPCQRLPHKHSGLQFGYVQTCAHTTDKLLFPYNSLVTVSSIPTLGRLRLEDQELEVPSAPP